MLSPASSVHSRDVRDNEELETSFEELQLLDDSHCDSDLYGRSEDHEQQTAPLLTREAYLEVGASTTMQYGVLGNVISICTKDSSQVPDDRRLYVNTNAPFSAVVCGVQGSGKSHSVSVLLESMLIPDSRSIGCLEKPLAGLVLHMGEGGPASRPSEAAWIGVANRVKPGIQCPPVNVYVSRSCLKTMRRVYAPLGNRVVVRPLLFHESELDAQAFLSLMAVGSSSSAPLYVHIILGILRDLGERFTYAAFMAQLELKKRDFRPAQLSGLDQRMSLIQSFIDNSKAGKQRFAAGQLTIIDLSDPFIDPASACGLFEIITRMFVRADVNTGKVLVVDEAHKYLSSAKDAGLTSSLLTLTREQRHLAMRVIISTQEPTVIPGVLLDLCTVVILHRFSSPAWWDHLAKRVSADVSSEAAFDKMVRLKTGEAIVLAPSALAMVRQDADSLPRKQLAYLGRRYLVMKTRKRITADAGGSVLVLDT